MLRGRQRSVITRWNFSGITCSYSLQYTHTQGIYMCSHYCQFGNIRKFKIRNYNLKLATAHNNKDHAWGTFWASIMKRIMYALWIITIFSQMIRSILADRNIDSSIFIIISNHIKLMHNFRSELSKLFNDFRFIYNIYYL